MKFRVLILLNLLFSIASLTLSCQRIEITYDDSMEYDMVQIDIDWSKTGMIPDGATVVFYPKNGTTPVKVLMTSTTQQVKLKKGVYSIIAINNSFSDFDNIVFRGINKYETIEAYAKPIARPAKIKTESNSFTKGLDQLAIAKLDYFEVTQEMVNATKARIVATKNGTKSTTPLTTLTVQPRLILVPITVSVRVEGINNIRYAQGVLTGMSEGIMLSNYKLTSHQTSHFFDFKITPSVSDYTQGDLGADLISFGFPQEVMNSIDMPTIMINNSIPTNDDPVKSTWAPQTKNVTYTTPLKLEIYAPLIDNVSTFNEIFDVNADVKQNGSSVVIEVNMLVIKVPDVTPTGGTNSGFNADVSDWGTTNKIPIAI